MQPTNRPVLSQTGSWEQQRHCLVSSASTARSIPASSQQPCLMVCTAPRWMAVLISGCVTHLLLVTLCCICLQLERDPSERASCPFICIYKQGLRFQTGQLSGHHAEGQEVGQRTMCTCTAGVTSHQSSRLAGSKCTSVV